MEMWPAGYGVKNVCHTYLKTNNIFVSERHTNSILCISTLIGQTSVIYCEIKDSDYVINIHL